MQVLNKIYIGIVDLEKPAPATAGDNTSPVIAHTGMYGDVTSHIIGALHGPTLRPPT